MPNPVLDPKTGLYLPRAPFPALIPLTGSAQVAGISPFVQPVVVVTPYSVELSSIQEALTPSGGTTPLAPQVLAEAGLGVPIGHFTWTPHTAPLTLANNSGIVVYRLQVTGIKGMRLEWVRADWSSDTVAPPAPMYQLAVVDGLDGTTDTFNLLTKTHWSTGRQEAGGVPGVNYYAFHTRGYSPVYTGQPTDRLGLSAVTPTLWMDTPLPDMVIPAPCTVALAFRTAVAAGGGIDNLSFKVRGTMYN